ncbi:TIGR04222 domain-containing membrane protein, partial [Streptomyces otsuchiensis]|uniref:TIGR04222 domain-containing membrane protein n=1 Tax=Streptomyces otsuchiensis TaxID=2681388 RepID=UPI0010313D18
MLITVLGFCLLGLVLLSAATEPVRARRYAADPESAAVESVYEAAELAGGPARVADTVICSMHEKERLLIEDGRVLVVQPVADDPVERAVLDCFGSAWETRLSRLRLDLSRSPAVRAVRRDLEERGLAYSAAFRAAGRSARRLRTATCLLVAAAALLSLLTGNASEGVIWLAVSSLSTLVLLRGLPGQAGQNLTASGRSALGRVARDNPWEGRLGTPALLAVGGVAVLGGSLFALQLADGEGGIEDARQAAGGGGAGSGADGGGGDGASGCG